MYIESLTLQNFRCFKSGRLEFWYPGRTEIPDIDGVPKLANVNVLLGLNGSGKSSALRAIALAVLAPIIATSGYTPFSLIRRVARSSVENSAKVSALLQLDDQDGISGNDGRMHSVTTEITRRGSVELIKGETENSEVWEAIFHDESPAFFLVGYGATRRVETGTTSFELKSIRKARQLRYQRVAGLFEDHMTLVPLTAWLPELKSANPGRYTQVRNLINKLLPDNIRFDGNTSNGDYLFRHRAVDVPFAALSDGYKAYIGWIGDLLYHVLTGCPSGKKLVHSSGLVLVDEIDLHIHPGWQLEIVPRLATTLPNLQFVFTTHSPIIVGSLEHANIYSIAELGKSDTVIERLSSEVFGLNADQILRSSAFGLSSSRAPEFVDELNALSRKVSKGEPEAAISLMRAIAVGQAHEEVNEEPPAWLLQGKIKEAKKSRTKPVALNHKTMPAVRPKPATKR